MKQPNPALLVLALAAALAGATPAADKPSSALELARQLNQAFIEVADKVSPSVVVIKVAHKPDFLSSDEDGNPLLEMIPKEFRKKLEEQFEKRRQRQKRNGAEPEFDGQGSGIIIREDGYILTNRHVVDGADKIRVRFKDGKEYDAEVKGVDALSDIAVVKVNAKGLPAAKLADSDKTRVGEFAIAIGAPFDLDYSVTFGHVSAKGRSRIIPSFAGGNRMDQDFIQTDANINPGNSGGPLVNINSEVIGINTLIRGLHTGIGFAIPSNLAKRVSDQLIAEGKYARLWLGVGVAPVAEFIAERPETSVFFKGVNDGLVVSSIEPEGPAAKSELKPSDVITALDGKSVKAVQDLRNEVRAKTPGQPVTLDVFRNGKKTQVKVTPAEMPAEPMLAARRSEPANEPVKNDLGIAVKPLTRELAEEYDLKQTQGLLVTAVEEDSPAGAKGIQPGDVITEVNHKAVKTTKDLRDALKPADLKKGVLVNFVSRGVSKFEVLKDSGN
ncbi:MAG: trypsin-like peptidase domain-containing protein [Verrucomicrobia bacterium]|nr:trypsin-like peptidase domain-containing protein [Verrucomicrobiota bacterium]